MAAQSVSGFYPAFTIITLEAMMLLSLAMEIQQKDVSESYVCDAFQLKTYQAGRRHASALIRDRHFRLIPYIPPALSQFDVAVLSPSFDLQ